jgi:hypothetical protein
VPPLDHLERLGEPAVVVDDRGRPAHVSRR